MKLVAVLWDADHLALREAAPELADRVQLNLDDADVGPDALRLQHFPEPVRTVVSVWTVEPGPVLEALSVHAARIAAWEVDERVPLPPPAAPYGERMDALAQVAFIRRPADLAAEAWRSHWLGPHTAIAIETQATFGYVQNIVVGPLTEDTPRVDAIVEELFPSAAVHDIHAFYGSHGDQAELEWRMTRLLESVATMGADRDIDVVPTSRYGFFRE